MADIAVIGSGTVGATLARKWAAAGHAVTLGARDLDKPALRELAARIGARTAGTVEAVRGVAVVVFAIPGAAMADVVAMLGTALQGRIVIDATNHVRAETLNARTSIQDAAPTASYYRAFSTLGWEVFDRPIVGGVQADLFFCGPEGEPRLLVEGLIGDVGLRPVWMGGAQETELADGLTRAWLAFVTKQGRGRRLAFKVLQD